MTLLDQLTPEQRAALLKMPTQFAEKILARLMGDGGGEMDPAPMAPGLTPMAPAKGPKGTPLNIVGRTFPHDLNPYFPSPGLVTDEEPSIPAGFGDLYNSYPPPTPSMPKMPGLPEFDSSRGVFNYPYGVAENPAGPPYGAPEPVRRKRLDDRGIETYTPPAIPESPPIPSFGRLDWGPPMMGEREGTPDDPYLRAGRATPDPAMMPGQLDDLMNSPYAPKQSIAPPPRGSDGNVLPRHPFAINPEVLKNNPYSPQPAPLMPEDTFDPNLMPGIGEDPRGMFYQEGNNHFQGGNSFAPGQEYRTAENGELRYPTADLNVSESQGISFYRRMYSANTELSNPKLEEALTQFTDKFAGNFGGVGRLFQDADYQVADRAAREFLAAILRKDTGAAITNEEFRMYGPMYLPMPGDKPELIKAKRRAREEILKAMEMGLGDAGELGAIVREEFATPPNVEEMSTDDLKKMLGL